MGGDAGLTYWAFSKTKCTHLSCKVLPWRKSTNIWVNMLRKQYTLEEPKK
jgi:hypothetical protein